MEEDSNNKDNTAGTDQQYQKAVSYADNLSIQLRKGFIAYCVLVICAQRPHYTGDIIKVLREAEMVVVEGTVYPLLSRLYKDGLLKYEWQRKYYETTELGEYTSRELKNHLKKLNLTLKALEKGSKK